MSETVTFYVPSEDGEPGLGIVARRAGQFRRIQWCQTHASPPLRDEWDDGGFRSSDGTSRCAVSFLMHETDDGYWNDCQWVEVWQEVTHD